MTPPFPPPPRPAVSTVSSLSLTRPPGSREGNLITQQFSGSAAVRAAGGARWHPRGWNTGADVTRQILLHFTPLLTSPRAPRVGRPLTPQRDPGPRRRVTQACARREVRPRGRTSPEGTAGKALKSGVVGRDATCGERVEQSRVGERQAAGSGSESRGQEGRKERQSRYALFIPPRAPQFASPGVDSLAGGLDCVRWLLECVGQRDRRPAEWWWRGAALQCEASAGGGVLSASGLSVSRDSWVPQSAPSATKTYVSPSQDPRDPARVRTPPEEPCPLPLPADR
ncbi:hypothetical protein O3P69_010352 [Scylla paramamosain]|uniref:Uncharacterized protein n=1 Tax=Scylla paramamosain TaxID=85552 RepID=A0AAW0TSQ4_SCYPA